MYWSKCGVGVSVGDSVHSVHASDGHLGQEMRSGSILPSQPNGSHYFAQNVSNKT